MNGAIANATRRARANTGRERQVCASAVFDFVALVLLFSGFPTHRESDY